ncbi:Interferon- developmental regulator 1 [Kappamyces sp. JEL0680]|nr:Interferon- developmental regulator 1 [Kappamyces sp. JEL0680]
MSRTFSQLSVAEDSIPEVIENALEEMEEKRQSVREAGLAKLVRLMSNKYLLDYFGDGRTNQLVGTLKRSLKKDGSEVALACRVLSLLWITCGPNASLYSSTIGSLREAVGNASDPGKVAALSAMAMITFIEQVDDTSIRELLESFQTLMSNDQVGPSVLLAALASYGLLYPLATSRLDKDDFNALIELHGELLDTDQVEIRILAAENIALLLQDLRETALVTDPDYVDSLHEIIEKISLLSSMSSKHVAKKDRASQKSSLREVLASVESGDSPSIELKFKKETVLFEGWNQIRQLDALRDAIGEGLNVHFLENPVVQEMFEWSQSLIDKEKLRLLDTTVGKQRAKTLKDQRGAKLSSREYFQE